MRIKMKGICKASAKYISNIFVVKEREMEIGMPTDVKHVAHIGWDGPSGTGPSWMNGFKTGPDFAATSIGNPGSALSPWSLQDFGESQNSEMYKDIAPSEHPRIPKPKQRRKKIKSSSSPKSTSSSTTSRSSRAGKSKAKFVEDNQNPPNIEVA